MNWIDLDNIPVIRLMYEDYNQDSFMFALQDLEEIYPFEYELENGIVLFSTQDIMNTWINNNLK